MMRAASAASSMADEIGPEWDDPGSRAVVARQQDSRELDRGSGTGVGGQHADSLARNLGDEQDAADGATGGDAGAGDDLQAQAGELSRGNDADVGLAGLQPVGALRR